MQYFPARVPILSADGRLTPEEAEKERVKLWTRQGLLLRDEAVLAAMDPSEKMDRLCCGRNKAGELTGDLADRSEFVLLRQYVFGLLRNMVGEIASGNVSPNPYTRGLSHNACSYCPYGSICMPCREEGRRNYKKMTAEEFWGGIQEEAGEDG